MKTLEQLLREQYVTDFCLKMTAVKDDHVRFSVYPRHVNGDTLHFAVRGNTLLDASNATPPKRGRDFVGGPRSANEMGND
jgi:hypothetical protein